MNSSAKTNMAESAGRSQNDTRQFSGVIFMADCDQPYPLDLVQNSTHVDSWRE